MDKTEEQLREEDKKAMNMFIKANDAWREGRMLPNDKGFKIEDKPETLEEIKQQLNPDLIAGILALETR
jgi:hypothetical protein